MTPAVTRHSPYTAPGRPQLLAVGDLHPHPARRGEGAGVVWEDCLLNLGPGVRAPGTAAAPGPWGQMAVSQPHSGCLICTLARASSQCLITR